MHLEIIDQKRIELLKKICNLDFLKDFSMGGGTALSLQLGLRTSVDFDFFSTEHFDVNLLLETLKNSFASIVVSNIDTKLSTLDLFIDGIKVSFFEYRYSNVDALIKDDNFKNLSLLSIKDIACMKIVAIIQRGTKKDFFDLHFIIESLNLTPRDLLSLIEEKYKNDDLKVAFMMSCTFFEDAELEELPHSFVNYSWEDIKKHFISIGKDIKKLLS